MIRLPAGYLLSLLDMEAVLLNLGNEQVVYYFLGFRNKLGLFFSSEGVNYLILF